MSPRTSILRTAGAALSLVSAGILAWGAWSTSWWIGHDRDLEFRVGLRGVEMCGEAGCGFRDLAALGGGAGWTQIGIAAFAVGLVAAVFLAAAAVLGWRGAVTGTWLPRTAAVLAVVAAVLGAGVALLAPGEVWRLGVGSGLIAYFAGAALGGGSAGVLLPDGRSGARADSASR